MMNLLWLVLLLAAIGGSYIASQRGRIGKVSQQAAIWVLIFVGTIAAIGMWSDISRDIMPRQTVMADNVVSVPQAVDGHYYLTLGVNGVPIEFVVDTGASQIVLSREDAARVGLDPAALRYVGSAMTANGAVQTAPVRLEEVALGPITDRDVRAVVNGGEMNGSLLGMTYLSGFASVAFENGELTLTR